MMKDIIIDSSGKSYHFPEKFRKKRKHRKFKEWVKLYFYRNRKKTEVFANQLESDRVITSSCQYHKGTFYKMSQMSEEDAHFDYFYKLKDKVPTTIFKKNRRKTKNSWKDTVSKDEYTENGKIILRF